MTRGNPNSFSTFFLFGIFKTDFMKIIEAHLVGDPPVIFYLDYKDRHLVKDYIILNKRGYIVCRKRGDKKKINIPIGRIIMNVVGIKDVQVDHIDHNPLNNCRSNLRVVTNAQNQMNSRKRVGCSSKYKGVSNRYNKWRVYIKLNGESIYLGSYNDEIEAAKVYDKKAKELFGEYASLNFFTP